MHEFEEQRFNALVKEEFWGNIMAKFFNVSSRELERAYRFHYKSYQALLANITEMNSSLLLLFYAAECGLKAVWCKRNKIATTAQAGSKFELFRHDLAAILIDLRRGVPLTRTMEYKDGRINLDKFHECWRYGGKIINEGIIQKELEIVCLWIGREL